MLKKNDQLLNLMFLFFFHFLRCIVNQTISVINISGASYLLHASK